MWRARRDLNASLRYCKLPSVISRQLKEEKNKIIYFNIALPAKVEIDSVECRKRLDSFTEEL